jgi:hypothetical protein
MTRLCTVGAVAAGELTRPLRRMDFFRGLVEAHPGSTRAAPAPPPSVNVLV